MTGWIVAATLYFIEAAHIFLMSANESESLKDKVVCALGWPIGCICCIAFD